jgi:anhydro-N-acetylmuramic acid kinase
MKQQIKLYPNTKTKIAIGLLSGTSVDGIDAVIVKIRGYGNNTKLEVIDFQTYPIPVEVKKAVLKNSYDRSARVSEICRLNSILGILFSNAVIKISKKNGLLKNGKVLADFIGSHGQTIHHLPDNKEFAGHRIKSTLQIGDPAIIANLTGVTTVGDFRIADCAVNGDGAPLVPYLDYILFSSKTLSRGLLNIGGIANITVIPKNATKRDVFAFDTGPGNMLIDGLVSKLFRERFDKDSKIAGKGSLNSRLFEFLLRDKTYKKKPPKSTGREQYGSEYQELILREAKGISKNDIIRTVTEFTSFTIWYNYEKYIKPKVKLDELIASGGGCKNKIIMSSLRKYLKGTKVKEVYSFGISADSKEAVLFAMLANECLAGNSANMPSVTGSKKDVILGKICLAY